MASQLLTPSPSPPAASPILTAPVLTVPTLPVSTPTLPAQINAATRKQHIELNRLIVDRLRLVLPPNAADPALLGIGLAAFAGIYFIFEDAWSELSDSAKTNDRCLSNTHGAEMQRWLATLRPEGLHRSWRLEADLQHISNRTGKHLRSVIPAQRKMLNRMGAEICAKPHVLLAYGWVMYMAIFSGGRWIRQQLTNAGIEFWLSEPDLIDSEKDAATLLDVPGFTFLSFDGEEDGEDIKALFKARLAEAEAILTQQERQEVVAAAKGLFDDCIALVGMLDREIRWRKMWTKLLVAVVCIVAVVALLLLR